MERARRVVARFVDLELDEAMREFGPMASPPEGWAVIREEVDELWDEIKGECRPDRLRDEAIQVAAMAMRFVIDVVPDAARALEREREARRRAGRERDEANAAEATTELKAAAEGSAESGYERPGEVVWPLTLRVNGRDVPVWPAEVAAANKLRAEAELMSERDEWKHRAEKAEAALREARQALHAIAVATQDVEPTGPRSRFDPVMVVGICVTARAALRSLPDPEEASDG